MPYLRMSQYCRQQQIEVYSTTIILHSIFDVCVSITHRGIKLMFLEMKWLVYWYLECKKHEQLEWGNAVCLIHLIFLGWGMVPDIYLRPSLQPLVCI